MARDRRQGASIALSARKQAKYWGVAAAIFFLVLWTLGDVILPFVLGAAIAYFLDPVADRLQRIGLSRTLATAVIGVVAILVFVVLALSVLPVLIDQTFALIEAAPRLSQSIQQILTSNFPEFSDQFEVRNTLRSLGESIQSQGGQLLNGLITSLSGFVNVVFLFVIVPVVAIYLLNDWDRMVARIDSLLPRDHAPTIRRLAAEIDESMAGFVRGQGTVCLIQAAYYALGLMLLGLNYGIVVGAIAGFLTFIPYVGAIVGGALAMGLALFQFWGDWLWIVGVFAVFQSGNLIEGNYLTPRLVGGSVGLHPVWLLFALAVFGALFGFLGLLVAVPLAAMVGVIIRFVVEQYRESALYRGGSARSAEDPPAE